MVAPCAKAASETDCSNLWNKPEVATNGKLTPMYQQAMAKSGRTVAADGAVDAGAFMEACKAGAFDMVNAVNAQTEAGAPFAGANSFTQSQAADRIGKAGFTSVSGLKKDADGIWRGTAMSGGKSVAVALDYKGNVVAK